MDLIKVKDIIQSSHPTGLSEYFAKVFECVKAINIDFPTVEHHIKKSQETLMTADDLEGMNEQQKREAIVGEYFATVADCVGEMASVLLMLSQWRHTPLPDWFDHRHHILGLALREYFHDYWAMLASDVLKVLPVSGGRLLNLCSGDGHYSHFFYKQRADEIICVDKNQKQARRLYKHDNIKYIQENVLTYEPIDSYFDVVLIKGAIEHFTQAEQQLIFRKAFKALKPNGSFFGDSPAVSTLDKHPAHKNEWSNEGEMQIELGKVFDNIETYVLVSKERTTLFWRCIK